MCIHGMACLLLTLAIPCQRVAGEGPAATAQEARIAALIEQLGDLDLDKQRDAQRQWGELGEARRGAPLDAMEKHADREVRRQALAALQRINAAKVNRLLKQIVASEEEKRQAAEKELSRIATKDE